MSCLQNVLIKILWNVLQSYIAGIALLNLIVRLITLIVCLITLIVRLITLIVCVSDPLEYQ